MVTVEFVENDLGQAKTAELGEAGDLVDVCDDILAPIPFSCRSASCATCQIEIIAGAELLEPPEESEKELLALLDVPANVRLACQARVRKAAGILRIKAVGT